MYAAAFRMLAPPVLEKPRGESAVRRAIGVAHDDRGDRLEWNVELLGDNLFVGGVRGRLAEVDLAGPQHHGVVGVDLEPGARERGVERVLRSRGAQRPRVENVPADQTKADEERAAALDELPARKRGAHYWLSFCLAISVEACCTASRIAA